LTKYLLVVSEVEWWWIYSNLPQFINYKWRKS
jgi:hypothetical protein